MKRKKPTNPSVVSPESKVTYKPTPNQQNVEGKQNPFPDMKPTESKPVKKKPIKVD